VGLDDGLVVVGSEVTCCKYEGWSLLRSVVCCSCGRKGDGEAQLELQRHEFKAVLSVAVY
jgi:hypothetical protein